MKKLLMALGCAAILSVTACKTSKTSTSLPIDMLTTTNWQVTEINGKPINIADFGNGAPTAMFTTDHKVTGKGGCNGYGGSYNLNEEGGINISEVFSTKMYCENAKGENGYLQALETVNTAKVEKDKLTLMKGVDAVLVFKAVEAN
jgi:heat shock protein HslJ